MKRLRRGADARALPQDRLLIECLAVRLDDRLHRLSRGGGVAVNQQQDLRLFVIDAARRRLPLARVCAAL
jgi:hypothetical protein